MSIDHSSECREVIAEIRRVMALPHPIHGTFIGHFLFLCSVLQNQNSGTKGAGLTGGVQQENLWFEMLEDGSKHFQKEPTAGTSPTLDHDYYFRNYPLSHKTIGWGGSGMLALAWSKNPEGVTKRTTFESSMVIVSTRKTAQRGKWVALQTGVFVIPKNILEQNVTLTFNNKSDSIITGDDAIKCMDIAAKLGLFAPFTYDHTTGRHRYLSVWHGGAESVRQQKP